MSMTRHLPLLDHYLAEQQKLSAVERFARTHDLAPDLDRYKELLPLTPPKAGEQYAFEVDLDACTGCKACVTACHNLNGLEEGETWRSVGLLQGGSAQSPVQNTITTACHHCLDPACMNGCPVNAFEKDAVTGIVKHLDDQCIGCQYCTLTCPYEVPQYSAKLGIVRKCDMCSSRLAEGEAPACVQACPNGAIAITLVSKRQSIEDAQTDAFLPGAPSPALTVPTTLYKKREAFPRNTLPANFYRVAPAHRHWPLIFMLVLTQGSAGAFALDWALGRSTQGNLAVRAIHEGGALLVCFLALAASVFHLGRPLYAYRALLGLRTSWMSREILAFGLFTAAAVAYAASSIAPAMGVLSRLASLHDAFGAAVAGVGAFAVLSSVLIYGVTRKPFWATPRTSVLFFGTAALLGLASNTLAFSAVDPSLASRLSVLVLATSVVKGARELSILRHLREHRQTDLKRTALLLTRDLRGWWTARFLALAIGGVLVPLLHASGHVTSLGAALSLAALAVGETLERTLFFAAVSSPGMPGKVR